MLKITISMRQKKKLKTLRVNWLNLRCKSKLSSNQSQFIKLHQLKINTCHHHMPLPELRLKPQKLWLTTLSKQLPKKSCINWSSKPTIKRDHTKMSSRKFPTIWEIELLSWSTRKLRKEFKSIWLFSEKRSIEIWMIKSIKTRDISLITKMLGSQNTLKNKDNWSNKSKKITKRCWRLNTKITLTNNKSLSSTKISLKSSIEYTWSNSKNTMKSTTNSWCINKLTSQLLKLLFNQDTSLQLSSRERLTANLQWKTRSLESQFTLKNHTKLHKPLFTKFQWLKHHQLNQFTISHSHQFTNNLLNMRYQSHLYLQENQTCRLTRRSNPHQWSNGTLRPLQTLRKRSQNTRSQREERLMIISWRREMPRWLRSMRMNRQNLLVQRENQLVLLMENHTMESDKSFKY